MNNSTPAAGVWQSTKSVTVSSITRHRHVKSSIEPAFVPPSLDLSLIFGPTALAGSIARTSALRNVPQYVLSRLIDNALNLCGCLIEDNSHDIVTSNIQYLADAEKTSFAGCVGAGITDLLMNAIGYTWRDNAEGISDGPRPDFIYGGGAAGNLGVVIAEAHGSFARSLYNKKMMGTGQMKYCRQVKPNLMENHDTGQVIHGYSVAFGSNPKTQKVFLHVSETDVNNQAGGAKSNGQPDGPENPGPVPMSLALATFRANFFLMNAGDVVPWIDWLRGEYGYRYAAHWPGPGPAIEFLEFSHANRNYLCSANAFPPSTRLYNGCEFAGMFAMEMQCAQKFLNGLSGAIRRAGTSQRELPKELQLLQADPLGFGAENDEEATGSIGVEEKYALYRDGLAVFEKSLDPGQIRLRMWDPIIGIAG